MSSLREYCYDMWDRLLLMGMPPKSYRTARNALFEREISDATLMVYFSKWRKERGLSKPRPHRRQRKSDETGS